MYFRLTDRLSSPKASVEHTDNRGVIEGPSCDPERPAGALRSESGYSLVEVMVAMMILAVAIIPMVGMFDAGLRAAVAGSNYDGARALANEKLEGIRALRTARWSCILRRRRWSGPRVLSATPC